MEERKRGERKREGGRERERGRKREYTDYECESDCVCVCERERERGVERGRVRECRHRPIMKVKDRRCVYMIEREVV